MQTLAEAFQDVPPLGKNFPPTGTGDNAENVSFSPITVTFVQKQIKEMDLSVSTGVDGISCRLLKAACPAICPSLAYLINISLFSGIVPQKWKIARVTPIFKGGDRVQITTIDPSQFSLLFLRFWKRLLITNCAIFLVRTISLQISNRGSDHTIRPDYSARCCRFYSA